MTRYEYGGDEFIFVELSESMSLEVNFQAMAITKQLKEEKLQGILDICPSNASYMIRFKPEEIHPNQLISKLKELEHSVSVDDFNISSRVVDVPILFDDPWTNEALMRFRDRHQDPSSTDLEYAARINGFHSKEELIKAITDYPYLVSMIGFVPGLPWCYQMVPREQQIEVPKYVRPRTYTPERAFGFGGAFAVIYPVQGAGGYQLFGIAAAPIYQKEQRLYDFKDSMTFPRQGDIFRYRSITMEEFQSIEKQVEDGTFRYLTREITFKPQQVLENPKAFSDEILGGVVRMIKVIQPGLQTTVQDYGRIGYYEVGMPPSGAMDKYSFTAANVLVGNNENAAALEITYMGPVLQFQQEAVIALTGGEIPPKVNGQPVPMWETLAVKAGDELSFDFVKQGARVYLAVAGGIDVPFVMDSRSTYTLCGIGGLEGRPLRAGDELKIGKDIDHQVKVGTRIQDELIPVFSKTNEIRVVVGLCSYRLTEESKERFFSLDWTVTTEANRVGYRFKGERLNFVEREQPFGAGSNPSNVVDLGYPIGSIQVPDGVEPIALLNDAVTGGGYATICTIISADLNKMAQIKTNEKVRFVAVDIEEALRARKEYTDKVAKIKQQLQLL